MFKTCWEFVEGLDGMTVETAAKKLQELSQKFPNGVLDFYADSDDIVNCQIRYQREETDKERIEREEDAKRRENSRRAQYEQLRKEFGDA